MKTDREQGTYQGIRHNVELDGVVYEVCRAYAGRQSAVDLVHDRILELSGGADCQNPPLTRQGVEVYNVYRGVGMGKEAR